jgi:hypothetical protein
MGSGVGNIAEMDLVVNDDRYGIVTTMLPDNNIYPAKDNIVWAPRSQVPVLGTC